MNGRRLLALMGLLSLVLGACAPTAQFGGIGQIITQVQPDRGLGAVYRLGEFVDLRLTLAQRGYLTLLAVNADQTVEELEKNLLLDAGHHQLPRAREAQGLPRYQVVEPTGTQRVRLIFTSQPGPSNWRFAGVLSAQRLAELTQRFIQESRSTQSEVVEVSFEVTR